MTLEELIQSLQALIDAGEALPETEVRLAHQPSYPLQAEITGLANFSKSEEEIDEIEEEMSDGSLNAAERQEAAVRIDELRHDADADRVIYLVASHSEDYAPRCLWERAHSGGSF